MLDHMQAGWDGTPEEDWYGKRYHGAPYWFAYMAGAALHEAGNPRPIAVTSIRTLAEIDASRRGVYLVSVSPDRTWHISKFTTKEKRNEYDRPQWYLFEMTAYIPTFIDRVRIKISIWANKDKFAGEIPL
ncbi:hypothetical protein [Bosea sp. PAMC 26642]|uniref:hypothetical protein n=1 Tax=Bosea sp. (strain PAMC 26642) TaxID=1792307 RepID=UPI0012E76D6B|nr:hypothetical protein [Bosea sp. PAMC 26642]